MALMDVRKTRWRDAEFDKLTDVSHAAWWVDAYADECVVARPGLLSLFRRWRCNWQGRDLYLDMCHRDPRVVAREAQRRAVAPF